MSKRKIRSDIGIKRGPNIRTRPDKKKNPTHYAKKRIDKPPHIEKPIKCPYCPRSFDTKNGLARHIGRIHPERVVPKPKPKPETEMWCPKCSKKMLGCIRYDKTRMYFHCPKCGHNVKLSDVHVSEEKIQLKKSERMIK